MEREKPPEPATVIRKSSQVVFTNTAHCRDCYRCLRVCPVKAIRVHKGQAFVVEERCIACGTCIRECPQKAKTFRDDLEKAVRLLEEHQKVAVSLAPSFAAIYQEWERKRLPGALRKLGFAFVAETAIGASFTAKATADCLKNNPGKSIVCTACPAVVRFVERYRPEDMSALAPVPSPMIAHAKQIKDQLGSETKVLFIGPCVAKKAEAERPEYQGLVDCVLTFKELSDWLKNRGIRLSDCEESDFDETPLGEARYFPLAGGLAKTAALSTDVLSGEILAVSGIEAIRGALDELKNSKGPRLIEPLFCSEGCVNGPALPEDKNSFARRSDLLEFARNHPGAALKGTLKCPQVETLFRQGIPAGEAEPTEEAIRRVLDITGKSKPEDQLNCGACGYSSCREKAIAVLKGMAEPEMCMPYVKRLAERRTDKILESSPNGILILDENLNIQGMNPAFRKFFMCSEAVLGRNISYLMDPDLFERLLSATETVCRKTVHHEKYGLVCRQIVYRLPEEKQLVGIFVNITESLSSRKELDELKARTIQQARELLQHQINMAQNLAKFLGKSAAQGEILVENLLKMAGEHSEKIQEKGNDWLWDIYTSK